jgi:hypothetical protein
MISVLIQRELDRLALPEWRGNDSSGYSSVAFLGTEVLGTDRQAEQVYRLAFVGIFTPSTPMSTIIRHVKLKTRIARRALKDHPQEGLLRGTYLPGKNGVSLVNAKMPESLW